MRMIAKLPIRRSAHDYLDESDQPRRLDTDDHTLIPPASDRALYVLLAVIVIGMATLFGASTYALLP